MNRAIQHVGFTGQVYRTGSLASFNGCAILCSHTTLLKQPSTFSSIRAGHRKRRKKRRTKNKKKPRFSRLRLAEIFVIPTNALVRIRQLPQIPMPSERKEEINYVRPPRNSYLDETARLPQEINTTRKLRTGRETNCYSISHTATSGRQDHRTNWVVRTQQAFTMGCFLKHILGSC